MKRRMKKGTARHSGRVTIKCRHVDGKGHFKCALALGRKKLGAQSVRVSGDLAEAEAADEAARIALARSVKRGMVDIDDLDHDDGAVMIHGGDAGRARAADKRGKTTTKRAAPAKHKATARPKAAKRATKAKAGPPSVKAIAKAEDQASTPAGGTPKANAIVGNGKETRATEKAYQQAKREYHTLGAAVRERHEAVAAVAAQAR